MKNCLFIFSLVAALMLVESAPRLSAEPLPQPKPVLFLSGDTVRHGCLYKPAGDGPFPLMVYLQATPKPAIENGEPTPFLNLAKFYVDHGYALFLPGRRTADGSFAQKKAGSTGAERAALFMEGIALHEPDMVAALAWAKVQSFVDEERVYVSGHSTGAIQALLLAKQSLHIRSVVAFSPGALVWNENALLQNSLKEAAEKATVPVFLIQSQLDASLAPVEQLGPELEKRGELSRVKVYPSANRQLAESNSFAFNAPEVWGEDVLAFLTATQPKNVAMKP